MAAGTRIPARPFSRLAVVPEPGSVPILSRVPIKLSVIMAAYNEEAKIHSTILDVLSVDMPCELELIVVDDGSSDSTTEVLASIDDERMRVVRHRTNLGKGTAMRTGRQVATGTHVVPFDADGEYSASDLVRLVAPVIHYGYPVVIGTRNLKEHDAYAAARYAFGNRLLTHLANVAFGAHINDLHSCLKLVSVDLLRSIPLRENGFGADTELVSALLRRGIEPYEVPISYRGRTRAEGKKIGWRDAVGCVAVMSRHRLGAVEQIPRANVVLDLTSAPEHAAAAGREADSAHVIDLREPRHLRLPDGTEAGA